MQSQEASRNVLQGVVISGLLVLVAIYLPLLGLLAALFIPLPIIFFRIRLGRQGGLLVAALTGLLVLMLLGKNSFASLFFIELLVLGFVMGDLLDNRYSLEGIFAVTTVVVVGSAGLLLAVFGPPGGTGVREFLLTQIVRNLELTLEVYESIGIAPETVEHMARSLDDIGRIILAISPGLAAASILYIAWVNFLSARALLATSQVFYPIFGYLRHWKAPDQLIWGAILCAVLVLLFNYPLNVPGINGLLVFLTIYFFQGIAIVAFYFHKKQIPRFARIFLYSLIALQQVFLLLVIGLGFFDLWLDFRKLKTKVE